MPDNIIRIGNSFDGEIADFLKFLKTGRIKAGVLVYQWDDDATDVLVIGESDITDDEASAVLDAGKSEIYRNQSVFSETDDED